MDNSYKQRKRHPEDQSSTTVSTNFANAGYYRIQIHVSVSWAAESGDNTAHGEDTKYITEAAIGGDFETTGDKTLYYFCGAPVGVGNPQTVSVPQQPTGTTWTWNTSAALTVDNDSEVKGVTASAIFKGDWIQIVYSLNGVSWTSPKHDGYTVRKPSSVSRLDYLTGPGTKTPEGAFYLSQVYWIVLDQFGYNFFPNGVPLHEEFGAFTASTAYPNENWGNPSAYSANTVTTTITPPFQPSVSYTGTFVDTYQVFSTYPYTRTPAPDQSKHVLVESASQSYYVGSQNQGQGCLVNSGTLNYYTDRADHE